MSKTIPYDGPIHWKISDKKVIAAMHSFYDQKNRSKRAGLPPPQYSMREFISWWILETGRKGFKQPTCGRIDHSRGYSWDNIELQSRSENSRECAIRLKKGSKQNPVKNKKSVFVYDKSGSSLIAKFDSRYEAACFFGVSSSLITTRISANRPSRRGGIFSKFVLRSST